MVEANCFGICNACYQLELAIFQATLYQCYQSTNEIHWLWGFAISDFGNIYIKSERTLVVIVCATWKKRFNYFPIFMGVIFINIC